MKTIHRFFFLIGLAFCALADGMRGRQLAINSAAAAAPPAELQVGIPSGLSQTAVAARMGALVAAGTPRIYAQALAIDAEQQQAWHDNKKSRQGDQASSKTEAEKIADGIRAAHKVEPTRTAVPLTAKQLRDRAAVVEKVEKAAEALAGAKTDDARATAQEALELAQKALAEIESA